MRESRTAALLSTNWHLTIHSHRSPWSGRQPLQGRQQAQWLNRRNKSKYMNNHATLPGWFHGCGNQVLDILHPRTTFTRLASSISVCSFSLTERTANVPSLSEHKSDNQSGKELFLITNGWRPKRWPMLSIHTRLRWYRVYIKSNPVPILTLPWAVSSWMTMQSRRPTVRRGKAYLIAMKF